MLFFTTSSSFNLSICCRRLGLRASDLLCQIQELYCNNQEVISSSAHKLIYQSKANWAQRYLENKSMSIRSSYWQMSLSVENVVCGFPGYLRGSAIECGITASELNRSLKVGTILKPQLAVFRAPSFRQIVKALIDFTVSMCVCVS